MKIKILKLKIKYNNYYFSSQKIQNDWYDNYFEKETRNFATEKGNTDIQAMSAPEYILSQLKYLDEEYERQKEFINPIFHDRINKINYQCLIGNHMKTIAIIAIFY